MGRGFDSPVLDLLDSRLARCSSRRVSLTCLGVSAWAFFLSALKTGLELLLQGVQACAGVFCSWRCHLSDPGVAREVLVMFRRSENGSQALAFHHSLWSLSASPSVLSRGVPSPVRAHLPVFGSCIVLHWRVLATFPTDRAFSFSAFRKELALVFRVRICVVTVLALRVVGAVSPSMVAYLGVHPSQWYIGLDCFARMSLFLLCAGTLPVDMTASSATHFRGIWCYGMILFPYSIASFTVAAL